MAADARHPLTPTVRGEEGTGTAPAAAPAPDTRPPGHEWPQAAARPRGRARPEPAGGPPAPHPPPETAGGATAPAAQSAPEPVALPDSAAPHDVPQRLVAHGCWYPSTDPDGRYVAFICDRTGVPQLWAGPVDGDQPHLLDADPDPVTEVSWSPDGRWIAYTTAPGGGELTRVLCVRPDGTSRRLLAGGEPGVSAHLGCWSPDSSAVAVTMTEPAPAGLARTGPDRPAATTEPPVPAHSGGWTERDGRAVLLGAAPLASVPHQEPQRTVLHGGLGAPPDEQEHRTLAAYLVDPEGGAAPVLVASEGGAPTLRVCALSRDRSLALVRRGPRGRREALVVRLRDGTVTGSVRVADGDPWIGGFAPDGRTLWLRSDAGREFAALVAVRLGPRGQWLGHRAVAARPGCDLELLALGRDGRSAVLSWNARGVSELEIVPLDPAAPAVRGTGPHEPSAATGPAVELPHEVITRLVPTPSADGPVLALSGSRRRPGVWWLHQGAALRTPWSSRDEDAVPPGRPPVRPVPLRPVARDGLPLGGWYYRAPGRSAQEPAPCVLHLHGGPEEQERPMLDPLYHELLGRGLDVFAPDVRGSSGYGRSFVDADLGEGRFAALDDVADCAAHVVVAGLADPRRLAVMGRSYGGYLTMASLVWHPELFRVGVAVCGMSDLNTFFAGTEPWLAESAAHKYGHPERDRDLLRALSPMSRVDALRAPVLAVHGEHDTNVPVRESEQFVRAARERGLEAELLLLHEEGHEFRRADNRRLFRRSAADWIQRHVAV
ncbi:peptidase S9 [Streptomyces lucensis JCM 4490]|uniref:Peptidase S9 n=1 Tax=Streptomyces lucensis JCM 4490 TaxID=1306176 RepID=A0A918JAU9_9ACTN|nr:prolyl oligopeptidase family serine peptidase [Streptomyces lucensis]GGW60495.1 peptidase S9 [Streptomyces lucensis JCM 4490]